jgi:hypothetical protein
MNKQGTVSHDEAGTARAELIWNASETGPFWWAAQSDVVAGVGSARLVITDPADGASFAGSAAAAASFRPDAPTARGGAS